MGVVGAIVVFSVCWFLALYCLLPIGVRSIEETGEEIPEGAFPGAPSNPNLRIKALGATVIAAALTALAWWGLDAGLLSVSAIDRFLGFDE